MMPPSPASLSQLFDTLGSGRAPRPVGPPQQCFDEGDGVRVVGLTSAAGQRLNGLEGRVQRALNNSGRHVIFVAGDEVLIKPENLRKVLLTAEQVDASAADAEAVLYERVRTVVRLAQEPAPDNRDDAQYAGITGRIRDDRSGKSYYKLAVHLETIFACVRSWSDVCRDSEKVYVHGYEDGSTRIASMDPSTRVGLKRVDRGIGLLSSLLHLKVIRRKAQHADMAELLADIILAPIFHPYALETTLQCASSLLNHPRSTNDVHMAYLRRFFARENPGQGRRAPTPMYERLRTIHESTKETSFTHDCAERLLRWSVAYLTGEAEVAKMTTMCREVIAEVSVSEADSSGYVNCAADNCLNVESDDGTPFKKCARCRLARYCSQACQTYDWKFGGHKRDCCAVSAQAS